MKEFYHGTLFAKILDKSPVRIYRVGNACEMNL